MEALAKLIKNIDAFIVTPLLGLIWAAALVVFLWGASQFILNADSEEGRATGRRHLVWGIIGMFIIVSVWAILRVLKTSIYVGY